MGFKVVIFCDDDYWLDVVEEVVFEVVGGEIFKWCKGKKFEVELFESFFVLVVKIFLEKLLEDCFE